jgi:hypothetical protein
VSREECNYIRCLGLNYGDHAKVQLPKSPPTFSISHHT